MPRLSSQDPALNVQHARDVAPLVPREWRASDGVQSAALASDLGKGRRSSDPRVGTAPDGSDDFPELRPAEPSLHADLRDDRFAGERPALGRRMFRSLVRFCVAVLIGVSGTLAWQSGGDQAVEVARASALTWAPAWAQAWIPSASTTKAPVGQMSGQDATLPQSAPVARPPTSAAATPPESVQQIETMARDLTVVRHSLEQLSAKQEEMAQTVATLQAAEQDIKQKIAALPRPAPVPKRKPPPPPTQLPGAQSAGTQSSAAPPAPSPASASSATQSSGPSALPPPRPPAPLH